MSYSNWNYVINGILAGIETLLVWGCYRNDPETAPFLAFFFIIQNQYWLRSHQK